MEKKKPKNRPNFKFIAIAVGVALGVGAIAYGVGRLQGYLQSGEPDEAVEQEQAADEGSAPTCTERAAALEARRQLGRVLLDLDDRNFGIAQGHLEKSVRSLGKAKMNSREALELLDELRSTKVAVAGDLEKQRSRFREHLDRLDALLDETEQR